MRSSASVRRSGRGICGGDGAGAGAEGCYRASMGDDWRVCIAFGDLQRQLKSCRQALIPALRRHIRISSSRTEIFLWAPSAAGYADICLHEPGSGETVRITVGAATCHANT